MTESTDEAGASTTVLAVMALVRDPRSTGRREELVVGVLALVLLSWPWFLPIELGARIGIAVLWYSGAVAGLIMMVRARYLDAHDRRPESPRVSRRRMVLTRSEALPGRRRSHY